jgi:hypothetical protein
MNKFKEFDRLFPHVNDEEKDSPNARQHAEILWQELDHLGSVILPKTSCSIPIILMHYNDNVMIIM